MDTASIPQLMEWAIENEARLRRINDSGLYRIEGGSADPDWVPACLASIELAVPSLAYQEPDYIVRTCAMPDDPDYFSGKLWGLHNTGQEGGLADADIDAPEGWDIRSGAPDVVVGVIDTGVRYTHEDIMDNMWVNPGESGVDELGNPKETNGLDDDNNGFIDDVHGMDAVELTGDPIDVKGHGSHVAGTIAATGNNGIGLAGVAWDAQIMALRFIGISGGATSDAIICLEYAIANGARLTSNSWGGSDFSQAMLDTITSARDAGQLFIAAAANYGEDNDIVDIYPADYEVENILTVAAVDRNDQLASFSNFGSGCVDVGAPGVDIHSLAGLGDHGYTLMSGTSMATPVVAGIAALLMAEFPESDIMGIKNRILKSVRGVDRLADKVVTGGMVNLRKALETVDDRPYNDDIASAHVIANEAETLRAHNYHATSEPDEPVHAGSGSNSIWYAYSPSVSGTVIVNTIGSSFDTAVSIYTKLPDGRLSLLASNDDHLPDATHSRIEIRAMQGAMLYIAVVGKENDRGLLRLRVSGPPREDEIGQAVVIDSLPYQYQQDNTNASRSEGEPLHLGQLEGGSLWLKYTPTLGGKVVARTRFSNIDSLLAVYTAPVEHPGYDDLALVAESDDAHYGDDWAEVSFFAAANTTYWFAIDGKDPERGMLSLSLVRKVANDDFADAVRLVADQRDEKVPYGSFLYCTREVGEPNHGNAGGKGSLWWLWSPETPGDYTISTTVETAIALYTGDRVDALSLAAEQIDTSKPGYLRVNNVQPDQSLYLAVATLGDTVIQDGFTLSINPHKDLPNDDFADAMPITGNPDAANPFVDIVESRSATAERGENLSYIEGSKTFWYVWRPEESGAYIITGNGSPAKGNLVLYGQPPALEGEVTFDDLIHIAHDRISGQEFRPWIKASVVGGRTYYIQAAASHSEGFTEMRVSLYRFTPPANDDFANALELDGLFIQREYDSSGATREAGEPAHASTNWYYNGVRPYMVKPSQGGVTAYPVSADLNRMEATLWFKWRPGPQHLGRRTSASCWMGGGHSAIMVYETAVEDPAFADLMPVRALHPDPGRTPQPGETDPTDRYAEDARYGLPDPDYDPACPDNRDPGWRPGASYYFANLFPYGEVSFVPEAGKTYYIVMGTTQADAFGLSRLSLWQNPNDDFVDAMVLEGTDIHVQTANFAATYEAGEPYHYVQPNGDISIFISPGGRTLWYKWTCPEDGTYVFDTHHSYLNWDDFPAPVPPSENPHSDNFGGLQHLSVYTGDSLEALDRINCNAVMSFNIDKNAMLSLDCTAGTTYRIALDSNSINYPSSLSWDGFKHEWASRAVINFRIQKGAHPHDRLAEARVIQGDTHQEFVDLKFASTEAGEPAHASRAGKSIWWKWTAPESGTWFLATASDFYHAENIDSPSGNHGAALAVYSGPEQDPDFASLALVASANAEDGTVDTVYLPAVTSFEAVAGQTYYMALAVDNPYRASDLGAFRSGFFLSRAPANDNFQSAEEIHGSRASVTGHNLGATEEPGEPRLTPGWYIEGSTNTSVWWKWTAPASGETTVSTRGTYTIHEMGVFTGDTVDSLNLVAVGRPGNHIDNVKTYEGRMDEATHEIRFNAEAGTTYTIQINGWAYNHQCQGPLSLSIIGQPGIPAAPTGFSQVRRSATRVDLSWIDHAVDESGYRIERAPGPAGPWTEVFISGGPDVTEWSDLNAGKGYAYRIRAEGPGGVSEWVGLPLVFNTALDEWRYWNFGSAEETALSSLAADPDRDGYPNLVEFALCGNPRSPEASPLWPRVVLLEAGGERYWAIRFCRPVGDIDGDPTVSSTVNGVTYTFVFPQNGDLSVWSTRSDALLLHSVEQTAADREEVILRSRQPAAAAVPLLFRLLLF
ncbi:MAG: S8 family serine peptidase [Oceanipulchritudo sp.]